MSAKNPERFPDCELALSRTAELHPEQAGHIFTDPLYCKTIVLPLCFLLFYTNTCLALTLNWKRLPSWTVS